MHNTFYVLKYPDGSLVGIDQNSGGYPWKAWVKDDPNGTLNAVAMWPFTEQGRKKALEYAGIMNKFELATIKFKICDGWDLSD